MKKKKMKEEEDQVEQEEQEDYPETEEQLKQVMEVSWWCIDDVVTRVLLESVRARLSSSWSSDDLAPVVMYT